MWLVCEEDQGSERPQKVGFRPRNSNNFTQILVLVLFFSSVLKMEFRAPRKAPPLTLSPNPAAQRIDADVRSEALPMPFMYGLLELTDLVYLLNDLSLKMFLSGHTSVHLKNSTVPA